MENEKGEIVDLYVFCPFQTPLVVKVGRCRCVGFCEGRIGKCRFCQRKWDEKKKEEGGLRVARRFAIETFAKMTRIEIEAPTVSDKTQKKNIISNIPRHSTVTSPASALRPTASLRPRTTPLSRSTLARLTRTAATPARTTPMLSAVSSVPVARVTTPWTASLSVTATSRTSGPLSDKCFLSCWVGGVYSRLDGGTVVTVCICNYNLVRVEMKMLTVGSSSSWTARNDDKKRSWDTGVNFLSINPVKHHLRPLSRHIPSFPWFECIFCPMCYVKTLQIPNSF